jgi:hypothetical protein
MNARLFGSSPKYFERHCDPLVVRSPRLGSSAFSRGNDDWLREVFRREAQDVGGLIAIAAMTKHEGFQWVQRQKGFGTSRI